MVSKRVSVYHPADSTITEEYSDCVGYAVTADQSSSDFTLSCTRVEGGQEEPESIYVS